MQVPFNDLARRVARHRPAIDAAMARVVSSGWFVLGREVERFEKLFADYCGTRHCVGVANGSDALELALRGLGIGNGHRVGVVANAGGYGSVAVRACGGEPMYVDVDPATANMAAANLEAAIASGLDAVIVTHLYGRMADMPALTTLARTAGIPLIEDCAQSHGAELDGRKAGSWGDAGCFSFYPTKNLGALGDGGAVTTDDAGLAERLRQLRQYGWTAKYRAETSGGRNSRLDELQAAILSELLPHLDGENTRRREIAARYDAAFAELPGNIIAPRSSADDVCHLYVVTSPRRDELSAKLEATGIGHDIHYPIADCDQTAWRAETAGDADLANTRRLCACAISLPCFPDLTDAEQERVITSVLAAR
jgi:aminotransferase EvaB